MCDENYRREIYIPQEYKDNFVREVYNLDRQQLILDKDTEFITVYIFSRINCLYYTDATEYYSRIINYYYCTIHGMCLIYPFILIANVIMIGLVKLLIQS